MQYRSRHLTSGRPGCRICEDSPQIDSSSQTGTFSFARMNISQRISQADHRSTFLDLASSLPLCIGLLHPPTKGEFEACLDALAWTHLPGRSQRPAVAIQGAALYLALSVRPSCAVLDLVLSIFLFTQHVLVFWLSLVMQWLWSLCLLSTDHNRRHTTPPARTVATHA